MSTFAVILPAAGQEPSLSRQGVQEAVRAARRPGGVAALGRAVHESRRCEAGDRRDRRRGPRGLSIAKFGANIAILGVRGRRRRRASDRLGAAGAGAREGRHRFRGRARCGPAVHRRPVDRRRCSRRPSATGRRSWPRRSQATLKRVDGKKHITETVDREVAVGSADAASLSPRAA